MTLTLVQQKIADNWTSGAKLDVTSIPAITNGNMLTLEYFSGNVAFTIASIVQSGVTWVKATAASGNTSRVSEVWHAINVTGAGTSIVINLNGTPLGTAGQGANLQEWNDSSGSTAAWSYLAAASSVTNGNSVNPATPSVTPTAGLEALIIAAARIGGTWSADPTGFTALTPLDSPASRGYAAYQIVASTSGSYQATWGAATGSWSASIATFIKAAAGGAGGTAVGVASATGAAEELLGGAAIGIASATGAAQELLGGVAAGVSSATGAAQESLAGNAIGIGAATGAAQESLAGAATGVASATGAAQELAAGSATGIAVATATAQATGAAGTATGVASATGAAEILAAGSAEGVGSATGAAEGTTPTVGGTGGRGGYLHELKLHKRLEEEEEEREAAAALEELEEKQAVAATRAEAKAVVKVVEEDTVAAIAAQKVIDDEKQLLQDEDDIRLVYWLAAY